MIEVVVSLGGRRSLEHVPDPDTQRQHMDPLLRPDFVVIHDEFIELGGTVPRGFKQEQSIPDGTKALAIYEGKI
ncbi:hypothetical protein [Mycobacteroides chelonae]|uniref:hypothetical protein n=1 Tax=Mycobacteroides chelonae TaxID=1774 RepID=UPI00091E0A0D|nr:hypothetical protein [Mycobacteroides chelonae]OHU12881.1 hypothetical protein BKG75_17875 [Mycobacteroides chelonae]